MIKMDGLVKNILSMTFLLCSLWMYSESYKVAHTSFDVHNNRSLVKLRRQTETEETGACGGDVYKFKCVTTPECIDIDEECDGHEHCPDGSDETDTLCEDLSCPPYLFRCNYGACIEKNRKCDGAKDCSDNSDELNCDLTINRINSPTSSCRSNQFQCSNGQCIEVDGKCDGIAQCKDKSDETEELCFNIFCPGYTFKCKYGACIDGDGECNNVQDCIDNSDEDFKKCTATTHSSIAIPGSGKQCTTPSQPLHGQWVYANDGRKGGVNMKIDSNNVIIYSCDYGYKLSTTSETALPVLCLPTGKWSVTVPPTCQKLCPSLYNSALITLSCRKDDSLVLCDKATDNTVLTYKCAPYYEPPHGRPRKSTCYDGSWDFLPECIPVCGEKRVSATPLIVNGKIVERGHYPWVVAVYSNMDSDPFYTNICGGSLITVDIVLTAAHCVAMDNGAGYPAKYFQIAAGKYYNRFDDARDSDTTQFAEVVQIDVSREYKGDFRNFRGDIALLKLKTQLTLSKVVQPVCYNNLPPLEVNSVGVVTGWGYTTTTGKPSDVLKELELPYNAESSCLSDLDPDFTLKYFTPDKLCAGFNDMNTSVCKGDSGSGLVFRNPYFQKRYFIHGIVSVAHSFTYNQQVHCNVQRSALFTKVDTYLEWIQLKVRQWKANRVN